ncbi:MAG: carbohydrate binding family 9 domain-containing protein [Cyclobacteriaceae bacterium]|nr:carbohydrate binding family 9 domain-containing protein [Cyclobacteriaceae bacterium HetDA_MAG_MS6]
MKGPLTLSLVLTCSQVLWSQEDQNFSPPDKAPTVTAQKVQEAIKVDGILDESSWQRAEVITEFFRMEPRQGGDYLHDTEVRLIYDEKNLYVGAFCNDSLGKKGIRVQDLRRDFSWGENDIFLVQLDPQNLRQYCVSFQTTPHGNQRDLQSFNDRNTDNDWNALWSVRTHRTDSGYYAEFAIPFKSIRYEESRDGISPTWGITFSRLARRDYEQTVFPAIPQSFSPYRMTYAASLEGLELPEPSANVRIEPYLLYQYDNIEEGESNMSNGDVKLGGDVKWAISSRSVLDLTFNTDFAQADVDRAVNNLERFNIFFPERRQFFLENSGIWAGASNESVIPFFSRTIGLQGNFNAAPARIDVGGRYTMRNEDRAIAGLYIRQAETANSPAANFGVARYLHNYGNENNIGVMLTHRMDEQSSELGVQQSDNTTLTIDGFVRPKDTWSISYMISGSRDNSDDTLGVASRISLKNRTNQYYLGYITDLVSEQYNPDMGFVFQKNVVRHSPGGYYIWRPKNIPWIRRSDPGVFFNLNHDFKDLGQFQQANIYIFPVYTWFKDNSFIEISFTPTWQNINFDFDPLGIQIEQGNYFYTRYLIRYNTDRSKRWSAGANYDFGRFYDGSRKTMSFNSRLAPIPHVAFTFDYERNELRKMGFENQNLNTDLITVGSRFALNPRVQLSAFYQYNTFDEQGRWNVRTSWEYQPLSFIYLVFNDTQIDGLDEPFQEQQFIGKVTFLKQF